MLEAQLGALLLAKGLISENDLAAGLALQAESGDLLGLLLVRLGALSEKQLLDTVSEQLAIPVLQPGEAPATDLVAGMARTGTPATWWLSRQAVVWTGSDGGLVCAAVHPLDPVLRQRLQQAAPLGYSFRLATRGFIQGVESDANSSIAALSDSAPDATRLRELAQETPVIEFVNGMFAEAIARRASDVHVEPYEDQLFVRMRVDGMLLTTRMAPRATFDAVCSRLKLLSGMDIGERRLPQDGRQSIRVSGQEVDLRVSTLPSTWGESVVLRLLGKSNRLPELSELGVEPDQAASLLRLVANPNGVVLITGPTGSGKTTTIYRLLHHLNDGQRKIVTVEDPVEFDLPGVVQVQTKAEIGLNFAAGLRSILRQDPDVIMVGEIRDPETARIAVQAALTGHLVISTVHTNSAFAAVSRLLDLGVESYLLADVIRGLVGQRLVRRLCSTCGGATRAERPGGLRPAGADVCPACAGTGFLGRVGVYEIAAFPPALESVVRRSGGETELMAVAREQGFRTMAEDGAAKVARGLTSFPEVRRAVGESTLVEPAPLRA